MKEKFLLRGDAAKYLNEQGLPITRGTLAKLACVGGGPKYRVFGNKAVYTPAELDEWADERLGEARASA